VLTLYLSRTRGTKMDSKEITIIQGATASLFQQKSHVEVADSKTSAASSDEDRLDAGISTFGLQTKRLSGAQRKKLIRERKMREWTWAVEKPPRKIPLSQVKGRAGSSGGVKIPQSDSTTPSLEKQQPKSPGAPKCRLRHVRKLLLESRWRSFIGTISMPNWMKLKVT